MSQAEIFFKRAIEIVKSPQANPKAMLVLLGMVSAFVLIIILVAYIIYSSKGEAKERRAKVFSLKKALIGLGVTGVAFLLLSGGVYQYSSRSNFCLNCHQMRPSVASWKESTHQKVECIKCHESPGSLGQLNSFVKRGEALFSYFRGSGQEGISADVSNQSCLSCHQEVLEKGNPFKDFKGDHLHFYSGSFPCSSCHNPGHKRKNPFQVRQRCLSCHTKEKECSFCHKEDVGKHIVSKPREFRRSQLGELSTCRGCHSMAICIRCHGVELPHPPNWSKPQIHAKEAAFEKKKTCQRCHDFPQFCNRCHRFPGHYPKWKTEHVGKEEKCLSACHRTKPFCSLCH